MYTLFTKLERDNFKIVITYPNISASISNTTPIWSKPPRKSKGNKAVSSVRITDIAYNHITIYDLNDCKHDRNTQDRLADKL